MSKALQVIRCNEEEWKNVLFPLLREQGYRWNTGRNLTSDLSDMPRGKNWMLIYLRPETKTITWDWAPSCISVEEYVGQHQEVDNADSI